MGQPVVHFETIMDQVELGHFADPEGHLVGVVKSVS